VSQEDPTLDTSIVFTVVFDRPVTGFVSADVVLSGTAGATTKLVSGSGANYTVTVSGMTQSGTVIASIPAGVAEDAFGNPNLASTSTDNVVAFCLPTLTVADTHRSDLFALPYHAVYDDGYMYVSADSTPFTNGVLFVVDVSVPEVVGLIRSPLVWNTNAALHKSGNYCYVGTSTSGPEPYRFSVVVGLAGRSSRTCTSMSPVSIWAAAGSESETTFPRRTSAMTRLSNSRGDLPTSPRSAERMPSAMP
jgi:hypothetical protein